MNSNSTGTQIYNILLAKNFEPSMMTSDGERIQNSDDADLFSFNYKDDDRDYGTVVVLLGNNSELQVYYADNVAKGMEPDHQDAWYDFLNHLRMVAKRNLLKFDVRDINRLKYTMQGMSAIKEGLFEGYYGTKKTSYNDQGTAKIIIKHNRSLGEEEQRFRNIKAIYIQNESGERFKMPVNNIQASKMMARHVAEGGTPYDTFGTHIINIVEELGTLSKFVRVARNRVTESNQELVDSAIKHYSDLKKKAKRMISRRGYREAVENYDPAEITETEQAVNHIRELFTETQIDNRIEEALPLLAKLVGDVTDEGKNMKEIAEFENWAEQVTEGTWAIPQTDQDFADLAELMKNPIPVGPDGNNAQNLLYDLVGDDQLFDDLYELSMSDPDGDARALIMVRLSQLGLADQLRAVGDMKTESLEEGSDVLFKVKDADGDVYQIVNYMGRLQAFDDDPHSETGGGMGPYEYDPKTSTIEHPKDANLRVAKITSEGNEFTQQRLAAIKAGKDSFEVDGKTYKVTGDTSDEEKMDEGFAINVGGGMVPVGNHKFKYTTDKSGKWIANSAMSREKMFDTNVTVTDITDNSAVVDAPASVHNSLWASFRSLGIDGEVVRETVEEVIETKLSQDEMNDFVDYVLSFYGEDGIYDMGATVEMIQKATNEYLKKLDKDTTWGGGDSVDRERVRDIMIDMFNLRETVEEPETGTVSSVGDEYEPSTTDGHMYNPPRTGIKTSVPAKKVELDEITKQERDELEDRNQHGELALKLAQEYGTDKEVEIIKTINKIHNARGHILPKERDVRDAIANKYYNMAEDTDIDTGKKTLQAERDPMLEDELARIVKLSK